MKCSRCNQMDSLAHFMHVDRNRNLLTESELTAYLILHPEDQHIKFKKVILCGMCYETLKNKETISRVTTKATTTTTAVKSKPRSHLNTSSTQSINTKTKKARVKNYYICPFCDTANEPLRNTCKGCDRILFSTEYETKRVSSRSLSTYKSQKRFKVMELFVFVGVILLVSFLVYKGITGRIGNEVVLKNSSVSSVVEPNIFASEKQATLMLADGSSYTGDVVKGVPHGKGKMEWADGTTYVGDFTDGKMTGTGTYQWKTGQRYTGQVVDGKPHGEGTLYREDGSTYSGQWINGEMM
ncbi:MORN repeat-containing protein [Bacillus weihaiensis]|uniref:MORN repeat-containing protein n=1 Tax=Bacillus weihaiensis TaxID=1547283 RepID=UPI002357D316|nr:hypothetical protein [Bacillus weihaiensis]